MILNGYMLQISRGNEVLSVLQLEDFKGASICCLNHVPLLQMPHLLKADLKAENIILHIGWAALCFP